MEYAGVCYELEVGAQRYVDVLQDKDEQFVSGSFYTSKSGVSGKIVHQKDSCPLFGNDEHQENAYKAL